VTEGQSFTVECLAASSEEQTDTFQIPVGIWRDGLCDCFRYGCCHPMLCMSLCFPLVAIAQVMTRLNLNPCAVHGDAKYTFKVAAVITVVIVLFDFTVNLLVTDYNYALDGIVRPILFWPTYIISNAWFIYLFILVIRTRMYIRKKYRIRAGCCGCCEDICCGFFFSCCTIAQMGRHTTNYGTHESYCCTRTGVDPNVPCLDDLEVAQGDGSS